MGIQNYYAWRFMGGKVDEAKLDRMMNDLGAQGRELAAAFDTHVVAR